MSDAKGSGATPAALAPGAAARQKAPADAPELFVTEPGMQLLGARWLAPALAGALGAGLDTADTSDAPAWELREGWPPELLGLCLLSGALAWRGGDPLGLEMGDTGMAPLCYLTEAGEALLNGATGSILRSVLAARATHQKTSIRGVAPPATVLSWGAHTGDAHAVGCMAIARLSGYVRTHPASCTAAGWRPVVQKTCAAATRNVERTAVARAFLQCQAMKHDPITHFLYHGTGYADVETWRGRVAVLQSVREAAPTAARDAILFGGAIAYPQLLALAFKLRCVRMPADGAAYEVKDRPRFCEMIPLVVAGATHNPDFDGDAVKWVYSAAAAARFPAWQIADQLAAALHGGALAPWTAPPAAKHDSGELATDAPFPVGAIEELKECLRRATVTADALAARCREAPTRERLGGAAQALRAIVALLA
jgi:hypothetical protein